jgi:aspartate beta-hydroxylase
LRAAYPDIRDEALGVLAQTTGFEDFVRLRPGDRMDNYLGGKSAAWEAYFFFRHGRRFDENHARCPRTSSALSSIELCEIADHAPEICFSLMTPGTHILPHFGVTNVRVVMHLPLLVPPDCALHILGVGTHAWREGELMMFDDTFQHEAWNRSSQPRLILLMDCWNPALTAVERAAVAALIHTISLLHKAGRAAGGGRP